MICVNGWTLFCAYLMLVKAAVLHSLLGGRFHARLGRNARENTHNGELVTDFQEKNLFLWPASLL